MKISFRFRLPLWLHWLLPTAVKDDLYKRSRFNGRASRSAVNRKGLSVWFTAHWGPK